MLGGNILKLRKKSGLSHEQIGEKYDLSLRYISDIENFKGNI